MTAARSTHPIASTPTPADFLAISEAPLVYWLRPRFFDLLQSAPPLEAARIGGNET